jgi:SAM-dependent methyltransferase
MKPISFLSLLKKSCVRSWTQLPAYIARKPVSFLSFDVEALPGRAQEDHVNRLIWGKVGGTEVGIRRIASILGQHKIKGNFLIDLAASVLYGDKVVAEIGHFILEQGHELHVHLHSEWLIRKWNIKGPFNGPAGLNQLNAQLNHQFLQFTAFKYAQLFGSNPICFRAGGYHFNQHTVDAARAAGFTALSNFNCDRHQDDWAVSEEGVQNEVFKWKNGLIEIPVDLSPEPLTYDMFDLTQWERYKNHFDRVRYGKRLKTFNLTLHSWSLLKLSGECFEEFAPEHEERLHRICEHLTSNTEPMGYADWLAKSNDVPMLTNYSFMSIIVEVPVEERLCTICGAVFGDKLPNDICSGCGSRTRHRQLHDVFSRVGNPFIGCRVLANFANTVEKVAFLSQASEVLNFDVRPVGEVDVQMDVQDMSLIRTESYDAFLAVHVLNHVANDRKALSEIHRALKPGGVAVLTVPYRENSPTSNCENVTEHYGSEALAKYGVGSYRRYGLQDVLELFCERFTVQPEVGFDPVTQERMKVFILRKGVTEGETHSSVNEWPSLDAFLATAEVQSGVHSVPWSVHRKTDQR